jgi:hypothetical protein
MVKEIQQHLLEIEKLKVELVDLVESYESNKYSNCRNLITLIEHCYWLIFRCYVDNNGDKELRDKYHKIYVNLNTTRIEMEIKVKALLNRSISLI